MDAITPPKPKVLVEAEPFIPYVREEDFDARLKPTIEPYKKRMGFLPNALKLYAHRPEIAEKIPVATQVLGRALRVRVEIVGEEG